MPPLDNFTVLLKHTLVQISLSTKFTLHADNAKMLTASPLPSSIIQCKKVILMKAKSAIILGCILTTFTSHALAADLGTVLCTDKDVEVDVTNSAWQDWWDHESIGLIGVATDSTIVSLSQRINPYKDTYIFYSNKSLSEARVYLSTGGQKVVSCD